LTVSRRGLDRSALHRKRPCAFDGPPTVSRAPRPALRESERNHRAAHDAPDRRLGRSHPGVVWIDSTDAGLSRDGHFMNQMRDGGSFGGMLICSRHGLRYDPKASHGCIRCRESARPSVPAGPMNAPPSSSPGTFASSTVVCPTHGLRVDPSQTPGCIRCRASTSQALGPLRGPRSLSWSFSTGREGAARMEFTSLVPWRKRVASRSVLPTRPWARRNA
jgi:hypothetical protein